VITDTTKIFVPQGINNILLLSRSILLIILVSNHIIALFLQEILFRKI
jgi:hypothetical protein